MSTLPTASREQGLRARRWDVMVLGSGVRALILAARLGLAERRVLIVEEDAARRVPDALREPFHLGGLRGGGALDACLRELRIPLIDRRRLVGRDVALQLVSDQLRVDIGSDELCASELVAWGLAKPDEARGLVASLAAAAEHERDRLFEAPIVRSGRRMPRLSDAASGGRGHSEARDVDELIRSSPTLAPVFDALARAVSNTASASPHPAARVRALGDLLSGGVLFDDAPPWLCGILRRRVESLLGEFRGTAENFELIEIDGLAGLRQPSGELWLANALVVATPPATLATVCGSGEAAVPDFIRNAAPIRRRFAAMFDVDLDVVPEGMARRVALGLGPAHAPLERIATLALDRDPTRGERSQGQLVARVVLERDEAPEGVIDRVEERLRAVMPGCRDRLVRRELTLPRWDDDDWLEEGDDAASVWPAEVSIRVGNRPPVYSLQRSALGGIGLECDALLGWSAGEAIAAAQS